MVALMVTYIAKPYLNNNKDLKEAKNFNSWFNERFDKYKVDDDLQNG